MNGDLPQGGEYNLDVRNSYRTNLPPIFCENLGLTNGATGTTYMDFENQCIVIDYGGE